MRSGTRFPGGRPSRGEVGPPSSMPGPARVLSVTLLLLAAACGPSGPDAPDPELSLPTLLPLFDPVDAQRFAEGGALVNAWADVDGDGRLDLLVAFASAPRRLYLNGPEGFRDVAGEMGIAGTRGARAAAWGDYDGDGRPDLVVGLVPDGGPVLQLFRNDGNGFQDVTLAAGLVVEGGAVRQLAWVDFDGDGDLDLFVAFRDRPNALFRNENGRLTDVAPLLGLDDPRRSVGALWFDFDGDGRLDLLVGNMDGDANGLFRNEGERFVDVAEAAGVAWGGRIPREVSNGTVRPCAADVDGDGLLDLFFANYGTNGLFLNRGDGTFEEASAAWGFDQDGRHDTCAFADFDHDGRIDLYVNGTVTGGVSYPDRLYRNTGDRFEEVTPVNLAALHASHGAQWADFDGDGAPDLAITGSRDDATHSIFRNALPAGVARRSLRVMVLDAKGLPRHPGAEVRLRTAGTDRLLGTRLVDSGSGYNSQGVQPVHFGLPTLEPVDVEVTLVGNQRRIVATLRGVDPVVWAGRTLVLRVGEGGEVAVDER